MFKARISENVTNQIEGNPSKIVQALYNEQGCDIQREIHPAIHDLGIKLLGGQFQGTNQVTVAILIAIKEVIKEFKQNQSKRMVYYQEL